jgi:hypothetical protein
MEIQIYFILKYTPFSNLIRSCIKIFRWKINFPNEVSTLYWFHFIKFIGYRHWNWNFYRIKLAKISKLYKIFEVSYHTYLKMINIYQNLVQCLLKLVKKYPEYFELLKNQKSAERIIKASVEFTKSDESVWMTSWTSTGFRFFAFDDKPKYIMPNAPLESHVFVIACGRWQYNISKIRRIEFEFLNTYRREMSCHK